MFVVLIGNCDVTSIEIWLRFLYTRGGQLVFDWDRLEIFLILRDRPVSNKVTSTKCHKCNFFYFYMLSEVLIEKCSFYVSCQFNAKSGAIEQLRLGDRPVDCDRRVGHPCYTPYEGLNYTILDKFTPLWKRIGEPPEIQIGCYRGDPGQQHHSGSSYDLFWLKKTVRRLRH